MSRWSNGVRRLSLRTPVRQGFTRAPWIPFAREAWSRDLRFEFAGDEHDRAETYEPGVLLHGTKVHLVAGDLLVPGHPSNFEEGRTANHVYVTATLDAATWGAELAQPVSDLATVALGEGRCRIYIVEPLGTLEDDPNLTNKKFPGNPTRSYRTREPVKVVDELLDWVGHTPEQLQSMRDGLADLKRRGIAVIYD